MNVTDGIAFNPINLQPVGGSKSHDDAYAIQRICNLLENVDEYEFCQMDNLPEQVTSSTPPQPMCVPSAATLPEQIKSTTTTTKSTVPTQHQYQHKQDSMNRFKAFHEERWDQKLLELRAFRKTRGHCLVPHTYPPNPQLARWVKRQRRQFKLMKEGKSSTMTPHRVEILEQEGFVWDSHEASWKEKIGSLRKYRAKHGHSLVPSNYRGNPQLATWVKCQRRQYKLYLDGKPCAMTPTRIAELEAEGFRWEVRNAATAMLQL